MDQFSGWKKRDCDQLIADLVGLIHSHEISGLGWTVPIADFQSVYVGESEYAPYFLVLRCALLDLAIKADNFNTDIRFWAEENNATAATALRLYQRIKSMDWPPAERLRGFYFSGKEVVGLQAADLMARESFKFMDNRGTGRKIRKPVTRLSDRITFHGLNAESLRVIREHGCTDLALIDFIQGSIGPAPVRLTDANYQ